MCGLKRKNKAAIKTFEFKKKKAVIFREKSITKGNLCALHWEKRHSTARPPPAKHTACDRRKSKR